MHTVKYKKNGHCDTIMMKILSVIPQYWEISKNDELRHGMLCWNKKDRNVVTVPCGANPNQKWTYDQVGHTIASGSALK